MFATGVHRGICRMPQGATVTLYVKPYIYRYVVAKLADPARMATDRCALVLRADLERLLHQLVVGVEHVDRYDLSGDREPRTQLVLQLDHPWKPSDRAERVSRDSINSYLEHSFRQEMFVWVDFYRRSMRLCTVEAIQKFFAHYDVRVQDYNLGSAKQTYNRYRRRDARGRKRRAIPLALR